MPLCSWQLGQQRSTARLARALGKSASHLHRYGLAVHGGNHRAPRGVGCPSLLVSFLGIVYPFLLQPSRLAVDTWASTLQEGGCLEVSTLKCRRFHHSLSSSIRLSHRYVVPSTSPMPISSFRSAQPRARLNCRDRCCRFCFPLPSVGVRLKNSCSTAS